MERPFGCKVVKGVNLSEEVKEENPVRTRKQELRESRGRIGQSNDRRMTQSLGTIWMLNVEEGEPSSDI